MLDKKCNFAPCISKIDDETPWEFEFPHNLKKKNLRF